jgi:hypothetical protein
MSNPHHLIRCSLLTDEGWKAVEPLLSQIHGRTGGAIVLLLEADPMRENYLKPSVSVFDDKERQIIRRAIRKHREAKG